MQPNNPNRILRMKGEYYRHYPVDFSKGEMGALTFKGWGENIAVEAPANETAVIAMHIWNIEFSPELPFGNQGRAAPVMKMLEWASRSVPIIKTKIPPVFDAARKAGIKIIHVASNRSYAQKYPGYQKTISLAGPEPPQLTKAPHFNQEKHPDNIKNNLLHGENFMEALNYYESRIDFPAAAKPGDDEYIAVTTHQLNEVLRHHGIWQLIYVGFAINWCLWFSPCGMLDMSRLGYRCSCIKEAVTAVENKESVQGELNKMQALWRVSMMFGYVHSMDDFIQACERLR